MLSVSATETFSKSGSIVISVNRSAPPVMPNTHPDLYECICKGEWPDAQFFFSVLEIAQLLPLIYKRRVSFGTAALREFLAPPSDSHWMRFECGTMSDCLSRKNQRGPAVVKEIPHKCMIKQNRKAKKALLLSTKGAEEELSC